MVAKAIRRRGGEGDVASWSASVYFVRMDSFTLRACSFLNALLMECMITEKGLKDTGIGCD
jgi:hypothetical protein